MDLTILFSAIDEHLYTDIRHSNAFFKNIQAYTDKMPSLDGLDIALIGVHEERGTVLNKGTAKGPDEIRKKLYDLKKGNGRYRIADLGNLKPGVDLDETYTRISEVCRILLEKNILPVIIGGSHDLDYGQYRAYEDMNKLISLLNIDAFLDLEDGASTPAHLQHINKILLHEPNFLFNYTHLAYQSYLIDPMSVAILEKLYFEAYRVGLMRTNMTEMEPPIRNADMLSFDITAIKSTDAPGNARRQAFGLSGEEACQICWYAGQNEKLSSAGFYEYNPHFDDNQKKTAAVVATMIWYFIEGFYNRKNEKNFKGNDYLKYVVSMPTESENIVFYKSKFSEKWWMEVPVNTPGRKYARNSIVPCSYKDYQTATSGEVPERYISTLSKLM